MRARSAWEAWPELGIAGVEPKLLSEAACEICAIQIEI